MGHDLDQWCGDSIATLELLERELARHETAADKAMRAADFHTDHITRLELNIGAIRRALRAVEGAPEGEVIDALSSLSLWTGALRVLPPPPPPPGAWKGRNKAS
jgi:hypothetical protein